MPEPQILVLVGVIFLIAGGVKGVVGVGLPTVAMGLMTAVIGLHEAVQLVVVPALVTNIWQGAIGGNFTV
ncbi:MAG TPA: sulfite exporter TauE/SafE family protein, partial [Rhodospirillaceae bacterium]|nr:sulfite exporter TauE/SafE family protein [Rhodospirillaceae bacterium]